MIVLAALGCAAPERAAVADSAPAASSGCPESAGLAALPPPTTVILVSVDTLHRGFLGVNGAPWGLMPTGIDSARRPRSPDTSGGVGASSEVPTYLLGPALPDAPGASRAARSESALAGITPRIDALLDAGARLDHVIVPRGLSGPSMASLVTGAYPRTHGVRVNDLSFDPDGPAEATPTLGERFLAAGYATYGYSSNQCYLLDETMQTACTWADPTLDQAEGDALLVTDLLAALGARDAREPVFAWLHLLDPHDPYSPREPWFSTFHPDPYDGPFATDMDAAIEAHMEGTLAYTDADRAWVEAAYASQVASTDAQIGRLLDGLAELGRLDDALVVFAVDHGDELARRSSYFYHGCSPYDGVLDTTVGIFGPGRVPAGHVVESRVSSVDIAPTVAEIAGLVWSGSGEGRSLLPELRACAEPARAAFFERGTDTAGVVVGGLKYFLSPNAGFDDCKYFRDSPYPNAVEELYALDADPLEHENLVATDPHTASELRATVCGWVGSGAWVTDEDANALVEACR